jgi:hypothetical protein
MKQTEKGNKVSNKKWIHPMKLKKPAKYITNPWVLFNVATLTKSYKVFWCTIFMIMVNMVNIKYPSSFFTHLAKTFSIFTVVIPTTPLPMLVIRIFHASNVELFGLVSKRGATVIRAKSMLSGLTLLESTITKVFFYTAKIASNSVLFCYPSFNEGHWMKYNII